MTKLKSGLFTFIALIFCMPSAQAQNGTVSSGADAVGVAGKVSYSVGQQNYESRSSSTGSVSEGLQQVWDISVISGLNERDITLEMSVYPNPLAELLVLRLNGPFQDGMNWNLYNAEGKMLSTNRILDKQSEIEVRNLTPGIYLFKVSDTEKVLKVFRLIKNN